MSSLLSIGTAVPAHQHDQSEILNFMQRVYACNEDDKRKLKFLYRHGGIETRYSAIPDYSLAAEQWQFYPPTENLYPFPGIEKRMQWFKKYAAELSVQAIYNCVSKAQLAKVTHLITVSCTGMSAPGLDLELIEALELPQDTWRTSVNFMGCYAAIHALKMADAFCKSDKDATVLIVCTELCTLHFQKEFTADNITSSMLFADGSAAVLMDSSSRSPFTIDSFYSCIAPKGKNDMAWEISANGFQMTLSAYIPEMIEADFHALLTAALDKAKLKKEDVTHWCIHPGGKKILEAVGKSLALPAEALQYSYDVLNDYGNMSSPTVLFVLERIMQAIEPGEKAIIFGAAFGPGLTMETFIISV